MNRVLTSLAAPALALSVAAGLYAQMRSYAAQDDTTAFHAAVREAVDRIPPRIAGMDSVERKAPEAAGKLLRPNKILSRYYTSPAGAWATLVFVHCADSRDMSGHYPPNCYRGSGWALVGQRVEQTVPLWGTEVPVAEYRFTRAQFNRTTTWTVYNFFVLPAGGFVTRMDQVQAASGDYRTRPYGAAQIQVIVDARLPQPERLQLLRTILEPIHPVIQRLQLKNQGDPS